MGWRYSAGQTGTTLQNPREFQRFTDQYPTIAGVHLQEEMKLARELLQNVDMDENLLEEHWQQRLDALQDTKYAEVSYHTYHDDLLSLGRCIHQEFKQALVT